MTILPLAADAGLAILIMALVGCGGTAPPDASPCITVCKKMNSCRSQPIPCDQQCSYGGHILPGLAPAPNCPDLAGQRTCVEAAVKQSCDAYLTALAGCPSCSVLDGSACPSDFDCQKYDDRYHCDLGRPGGYCTAPCQTADDCSGAGPEICATSRPPSFAPQAPATQAWCLLGCLSDDNCRNTEAYICVDKAGTPGFGVCDL
jgi:hypothetical protein